MTTQDFKDIAPYEDSDFQQMMSELVKEPGFEHAIKYVMPDVDYPEFASQLLKINTKDEFQSSTIAPFLEMLVKMTSTGLDIDGLENYAGNTCATFISNHRDIVLDASFLYLCLLRNGRRTGEIALGDNLLVYEWIEKLVKLNKGFIVKRNLKMLKAFEAAKQLSAYIRHSVTDKKESVWIAQREGRAKDSNDRTQEGVLKMLALSGNGNIAESLMALNITPVTISYEYDPNDYLKAREFLLKNKDPEFQKSQRDDLFSMETGLLGFKGEIHYHISPSINDELSTLTDVTDKNLLLGKIAEIMDRRIHNGYQLFAINYICYDKLHNTAKFADRYTTADVEKVEQYISDQLDKVTLPEGDITDDDRRFMHDMMLTMYSNPLKNKLATE